MIIHYLYLVRVSILPLKTDTPLIIDPNTVLSSPASTQLFQTIGRWNAQVLQNHCPIEHPQFTQRNLLDGLWKFARPTTMKYLLRLL